MSHAEAAALAATQHGLITHAQAVAAGLSVNRVRTLVDAGHWERRATGLFAVAGSPRTYEQEVMAACLAARGGAVASHGCAARLLGVGIPAFARAGVVITVPRGVSARVARSLGATVHESRSLTAPDRRRVNGIPVTSPTRLVVDLLGEVPASTLHAVADDVLWRLRGADPVRKVREVWTRVADGRHTALLDAALLPWTPGPNPGSPKEMALCRVLMLHGLPRPVRQHRVDMPGRRAPRYLDLAYPDVRVAIEYDGRRDHGPRQWQSDAAREDELGSLGWVRLPAGRRDLDEPHASTYCDSVRAACARDQPQAGGRPGTVTTVRVAAAR